jgi:hypothetical protein
VVHAEIFRRKPLNAIESADNAGLHRTFGLWQ